MQRKYKPATIIDLATLTGAILISLGHEWAGLFSNDDDLADEAAARPASESATSCGGCRMAEPFDRLMDSPIADMKNVGPREGGSITAAQFIQRFVENGVKWAHIDMAGKAWSDKAELDLRQGRDRIRRAAARPICRGRARSAEREARAVQVDFYQLRGTPAEQVIASIAEKLLAATGGCSSSPRTRPSCTARPDALGPGRDELPSARRSPAARTTRGSRSCCRPAPMRPISRATC